jgi:hypothetical protein
MYSEDAPLPPRNEWTGWEDLQAVSPERLALVVEVQFILEVETVSIVVGSSSAPLLRGLVGSLKSRFFFRKEKVRYTLDRVFQTKVLVLRVTTTKSLN